MQAESTEKLWNANYLKIWTSNFIIHLAFTLIVPLLPLYLSDTFGATKDTIGLVLAGYSVMAIIVRPFSGYVVDSFPRKTILLVSYFFFFLFFTGYLVAGSLTMFAIFRTLHGAPFGATAVATSTVAIDALPSSRRTEGIGYYGLSSNLATATGPVIAIFILQACGGNFTVLFALSLAISFIGLILDATLKLPQKQIIADKKVISLDRFFLTKAFPEAIPIILFSCSYGIVSTYVAIYGRQELGITSGTGIFFTLFAIGLIISRLTGAHALRKGLITRNAIIGVIVAALGFSLFACLHNLAGYYGAAFVIGLGNGHMYPAFNNMFIDLAQHNQRGTANSSLQTSWDGGVGLGVLIGGVVAEHLGYHAAFYSAMAINILGAAFYFFRTRHHFETGKLR